MTKLKTRLLKDLPIKTTPISDSDYVINTNNGTTKLKVKDITKNVTDRVEILEDNISEVSEQLDNKANELDLQVERNRIDLLTRVENGETDGNTELLDIRNGADGIKYKSSGDAVRQQFKKVNNNLNKLFLDGANLFDSSIFDGCSNMGITIQYDNNTGCLSINGTCTGVGAFWKDFILNVTDAITVSIRYISGSISGNGIQFDLYNTENVGTPIGSLTSSFCSSGGIITKTLNNINSSKSRLYVKNGTVCNNLVVAIQIECGAKATNFVKYGSKEENFLNKSYADKINKLNDNLIITDAKQDLGYFDKGAVVICVDDGTEYDKPNAWNLVKEYNIPIVFALMKECHVCQNNALLTELKSLISTYKCEVCQHGVDVMDNWNVSRINTFYKEQIEFFNSHGIQVNNFVAPENKTSMEMRYVGQNYFDMMFSEFPNKNGITIENKKRSNRYKLSRTSITPGYGTAHYFPRMLRTKTEGLLYVMYVHSVALNNSSYMQLVRDIIEYARDNNITITTFRDFYNNY